MFKSREQVFLEQQFEFTWYSPTPELLAGTLYHLETFTLDHHLLAGNR
jgi:hypothetical protein